MSLARGAARAGGRMKALTWVIFGNIIPNIERENWGKIPKQNSKGGVP
jgi:hypothetical protein